MENKADILTTIALPQRELKKSFDIRYCAEFSEETRSYAIGTSFPVDQRGLAWNASMYDLDNDKEELGEPIEEFWTLYWNDPSKEEETWVVLEDRPSEEEIIKDVAYYEAFVS